MKKVFSLVFLTVVGMMFIACSSGVDQDEIYTAIRQDLTEGEMELDYNDVQVMSIGKRSYTVPVKVLVLYSIENDYIQVQQINSEANTVDVCLPYGFKSSYEVDIDNAQASEVIRQKLTDEEIRENVGNVIKDEEYISDIRQKIEAKITQDVKELIMKRFEYDANVTFVETENADSSN